MSTFSGIPEDAVAFYAELGAGNNTKAWWETNKPRYAAQVREPVGQLLDLLADEFGEGLLFRPYRDVRFSRDKSPYKDHQGAFVQTSSGIGWYLQVSADGLMTAAGLHACSPDQVARLREAVDEEATGSRLQRIVDTLQGAGFDISGEQLKTRPRGTPEDHPRLGLLRHKSLTAGRQHGVPQWLPTPEVADHVRADWQAMRPLVAWLDDHVGPSTTALARR